MIMLHFCRRKYSLAPNNFFLSDKLDQIVAISDEEVATPKAYVVASRWRIFCEDLVTITRTRRGEKVNSLALLLSTPHTSDAYYNFMVSCDTNVL
jgi:hypothetical protein